MCSSTTARTWDNLWRLHTFPNLMLKDHCWQQKQYLNGEQTSSKSLTEMVLRYANYLNYHIHYIKCKNSLLCMYTTDKSKGDGKLTRPLFDRHLPVVNFQTGIKRCQRAAPPLREDVAVEQEQGGSTTPALGTSPALNGVLQTALGLNVQNVVKNLEIVQRRSTGWIKGLENMLCSQTSFLGHNLLKKLHKVKVRWLRHYHSSD